MHSVRTGAHTLRIITGAGMEQVNNLSPTGSAVHLAERIGAVEEKLTGAARSSSVDTAVVQQAVVELQAIRAELEHGSNETGNAAASGSPQQQGASLDKSVDHDRMARAMSELKSGEFDMKG